MSLRSREQVACLISCMISSASSVALTTLVTLFATSTLTRSSIHTQALAAAVLDILALTALLLFTVVQYWTSSRIRSWTRLQRWTVILTIICPSAAASILSIVVLAWMHNNGFYLVQVHAHPNTWLLTNVAVAMWALSLFTQVVFFTLSLRQPSLPNSATASSERGAYSMESAYKDVHPISMRVFQPPNYSHSIPDSPTISVFTTSPMASVRNSMVNFLRPVTSKSHLISPRKDSFSMIKDSTNLAVELPAEPVRQEDGFETWEVDPHVDATSPVSPTRPISPTQWRLETIPGSRPVSPARPLDGPFPLASDAPESIPLPDSPRKPRMENPTGLGLDFLESPSSSAVYLPHSPISTTSSPTTRAFVPPFAPALIRRPSGPNDQSHIHPLFRTDSPTPPPTASPGTILTASQWGGTILPVDADFARGRKNSAWSRNGDGSRAASPSASLAPSSVRSMSRPGSSKGATAPSMLRSYSQGDLKEAQRSMSAVAGRAPTPPMPELSFLGRVKTAS